MSEMYTDLEKQLRIMIQNIAPDTIYPRECKILKVNNENSVNVKVNIGETVTLHNIYNIGKPEKNNNGLLIPVNGSWNNSICLSDGVKESCFKYVNTLEISNPSTDYIYFLTTENGVDLYIYDPQNDKFQQVGGVSNANLENYYTKTEIDEMFKNILKEGDLSKWLQGLIGNLTLSFTNTKGLPGTVLPYTVNLKDFYDSPMVKTVSLLDDKDKSLVTVDTDSNGVGSGNLTLYESCIVHAYVFFKQDYFLSSESVNLSVGIQLSLTGNVSQIDMGGGVTLTLKVLDNDNVPVKDINIKLFKNSAVLTTLTTDSNGVATYTYTSTDTELLRFYASFEVTGDTGVHVSPTVTLPSFQYYLVQDSNGDLYLEYNPSINPKPVFTLESNGDLKVDKSSVTHNLILTSAGDLYVHFD